MLSKNSFNFSKASQVMRGVREKYAGIPFLRPQIHRGYFMESATYGILFTSCLYRRTNERVPERVSTIQTTSE
jgi:hypothetical protein